MPRTHQPCPCGKSSDAYTEFDNGGGYCHSGKCGGTYFPGKGEVPNDVRAEECTFEHLPFRGLTRETLQKYDILTKIAPDGRPISVGLLYAGGAVKVRKIGNGDFPKDAGNIYTQGSISTAGLFAADKFPAGSARSITIVEGEFDAPSVYQMLGSKYPCVSVQSSSSAKRDCTVHWDYLNSFERIYLALDADEPGQKATRDIAGLFDFNKVYHVRLSREYKDGNGYLQSGAGEEFKRSWYNAKRFMPEGIVSSFSEVKEILAQAKNKPTERYPFPTLQEMTDGIRTGEFVLVTALEGIGKTEFIRRIESTMLAETKDRIGIIHLEEGKDRVIKGLAGHQLRQPVHLPGSNVSDDEIFTAYQALVRDDERCHIYGHVGSDDPNDILDTARFLTAACGCRRIFLDHLTMAVTGWETEDERRTLDYLSTALARMCNELDFTLFCVSHVNDDGLTRGSRNISKVAHTWVHLDRDVSADNDFVRNIARVTIKKNRPTGRTGPAGKLIFNPETFMLNELSEELPS